MQRVTFVKEYEKVIKCNKKESWIWGINKDFYLKNSKSLVFFKEMLKGTGVSKTHKRVRKVSKIESGNEFKYF